MPKLNAAGASLFIPMLVVLAGSASTSNGQQSAPPPASLADRLAAFESKLDAARKDNHIPGLAVAIVLDDKVIYTRGLGVRDTETNVPVDAHTIFGIGSSSKAFTSALLAMMIDDGKLASWDVPARTYVPQLTLKDPIANEQITLRDTLCHRSGLSRTDLCWYGMSANPGGGGPAAIDAIFAAVARAQPVDEFRKAWNYSNPMFLVAGLAAAKLASEDNKPTDWHTLIQSRLFVPLGMASTNTSLREMLDHENHAKGYEWDEDTKSWTSKPPRDLFAIAPAGAINSNAIDMAQWIRLQLNKGTVDGKALITPPRFDEMWAKQIDFPGGGYALGWMVRDLNGTRYVEHGGNIDGYAAEVALFPDKRAGLVLLTNVTSTPLASTVGPMVYDVLFPAPADPNALPSEQLQQLTGSYKFEQLNVTCKVLTKDGKLHIDVPGQTTYELKWPDAEGKWTFALTDTIKIDFERAPADSAPNSTPGKVLAVRLYQAGLTMRMPREGVEQPPEPAGPFTREQLNDFEGTYHVTEFAHDWTVKVDKGHLAVDVPKERLYKLLWPTDDGTWKFELLPRSSMKFVRDEHGKVISLDYTKDGRVFKAPKTAEPVALPALADLLARRAKSIPPEALASLGVVTLTGSVDLVNQGIVGDMIHTFDAAGRMNQIMNFGPAGAMISAYDGVTSYDQMMGPTVETERGSKAAERARSGLGVVLGDLNASYEKIEVTGVESLDGERAVALTCTPKGATTPETTWLDPDTGLTLQQKFGIEIVKGARVEVTVRYRDYKLFEGVMIPMSAEIQSMAVGKGVILYKDAKFRQADSDAVFRISNRSY